jgi:hypothetical protein
MSDYFSDRENGSRARTDQVISPIVWAGLVGTVQALINSGAFGLRFPEQCPCFPEKLAVASLSERPPNSVLTSI